MEPELKARLRQAALVVGGVGFVAALALTGGGNARGGMAGSGASSGGSFGVGGLNGVDKASSSGAHAAATSATKAATDDDHPGETAGEGAGQTHAVGEAHIELGQSLLPLGDLLRHHQDVVLNGQHISFATSVVPEPVHDVLDRVEKGCEGDGSAKNNGAPEGYTLSNVHREEAAGIGAVLCTKASNELFARAAEAILHEGMTPNKWLPVHYTYAQPTNSGKTLVYSVWSEEAIDMDKLYAPTGDAPGTDPPGGMRPLGSRRILSAIANKTDYVARVYETSASANEVERDYDAQMKKAGWTSSAAVATKVPNTRIYTGAGRDLAVEFQPQERGTIIAMAEMPAEE